MIMKQLPKAAGFFVFKVHLNLQHAHLAIIKQTLRFTELAADCVPLATANQRLRTVYLVIMNPLPMEAAWHSINPHR